MKALCLFLLWIVVASAAEEPSDPAAYERWLERFSAQSIGRHSGKDNADARLIVTAVESEESENSVPELLRSRTLYRYGCEVSIDGRVRSFSHSSRGSRGGGYGQIAEADRRRLEDLLAHLPPDGARLPPVGRRVVVQVTEGRKVRLQVYDRANAPAEILELLRLAQCGIRAWLPQFKPVAEFGAHEHSSFGVFCLSLDRSQIITVADNGPFKFWDPNSRDLVKERPRRSGGSAAGLTFSPDGRLAVFEIGVEIRVMDTGTWQKGAEISEPMIWQSIAGLSAPVFTEDGRYLLLQSTAPALRILDTVKWEWMQTLPGLPPGALAYVPAPGGKRAIFDSGKGTIALWDVERQHDYAALDSGARIHRVSFSPDGTRVAMATAHEGRGGYWTVFRIRVWHLATGGLLHELRPFEQTTCEAVDALLWTPDGQYVIGATKPHGFFSSRSLCVWSAQSGRHRGDFTGPGSNVTGAALLPDGRLVAGCHDGMVRFWDLAEALKRIREFEMSLGEEPAPPVAAAPPRPAPAIQREAMPALLKLPAPAVKMPMRVEFGAFETAERGAAFRPATSFPLRPGTHYGWRLHVGEGRDSVLVKEELRLPKAPKIWNSVNSFRVSDDGLTGITESEATVINGSVEHGWSVVSDDPPGRYQLRLTIDGKLIGEFEFELVEPKK